MNIFNPHRLLPPDFSNLVSGAPLLFSLRELTTSWSGQPVIKVRRESDNAEQDFTAAQVADGGNHIKPFVDANGASIGRVSRWYNQSGSGNDLITPATLNEPLIYNGTVDPLNGSNQGYYLPNGMYGIRNQPGIFFNQPTSGSDMRLELVVSEQFTNGSHTDYTLYTGYYNTQTITFTSERSSDYLRSSQMSVNANVGIPRIGNNSNDYNQSAVPLGPSFSGDWLNGQFLISGYAPPNYSADGEIWRAKHRIFQHNGTYYEPTNTYNETERTDLIISTTQVQYQDPWKYFGKGGGGGAVQGHIQEVIILDGDYSSDFIAIEENIKEYYTLDPN